jgi:hypothetical protein
MPRELMFFQVTSLRGVLSFLAAFKELYRQRGGKNPRPNMQQRRRLLTSTESTLRSMTSSFFKAALPDRCAASLFVGELCATAFFFPMALADFVFFLAAGWLAVPGSLGA